MCRSHLMMPHCCALWATSPWTTSTTRKRGTCPRGVALERRDHLHALPSGNNTGKRWGISLGLLLMMTTYGHSFVPCSATQGPSGGFRMPSMLLSSHEVSCRASERRLRAFGVWPAYAFNWNHTLYMLHVGSFACSA